MKKLAMTGVLFLSLITAGCGASAPDKNNSPETTPPSNEQQKDEATNYNWVIYVDDTYTLENGPMKSTIAVNFKAINTSGDITGKYTGTASAKTVNNMEAGGGKIDATTGMNSDPFEFEIGPYIELAPLVELEDGDLAPLKPEKDPDYIGNGRIRMAGNGSGTVTAGGYSGSGNTESDSTDPFSIVITGALVRLTVSLPQGTLYFDGYIRGEGK